MVAVRIGKDLDIEIEMIEERLGDLERELYAINRIRDTHKIDLMSYVERSTKINNEMSCLQDILEDKKETRREFESKLKGLKAIEYKVAYKKCCEGKPSYEIAEELGYSYIYIRKIVADLKKRGVTFP